MKQSGSTSSAKHPDCPPGINESSSSFLDENYSVLPQYRGPRSNKFCATVVTLHAFTGNLISAGDVSNQAQ